MNYLSNTISNGDLLGVNEKNNIYTYNYVGHFFNSLFKR